MLIMSKEEIHVSRKWPANAKAPLSRDEQIELMTTSRSERLRQNIGECKMEDKTTS